MLFDDILDKNRELAISSPACGKVFIKDAVVFKLDKNIFDESFEYWKVKKEIGVNEIDYARTPYQSLFFSFGSNEGYWLLGENIQNLYYGITVISFNPVADDFAEHCQYERDNWTNAAPELKKYNLIPRLSAVSFDLEKKIATFPCISGIKINKGMNLAEYYKNYIFANSLVNLFVIVRILTILNCINIRTAKHIPNPKIQSRRKKRGKLPLVSYYTLEVNTKQHGCGGEKKDLWSNRIHIQRGHFKRYTEEKPLFGKHVGLWWWQPSVRGRNREGIVFKDYELT